jgi:hypothetical protein
MPITTCTNCGGSTFQWTWEEAFNKFGFGDGNGQVMTVTVAQVLREAGYTVEFHVWGLHNVVIDSIKRDGVELIPPSANVGYDDPRKYLPRRVKRILDAKLPAHGEVVS